MPEHSKTHICPVERAGSLDTKFRKLIQNPKSFLKSRIKEGMITMDLGCGPGFFTTEMAIMVGRKGKVYAVDLQQGMLDKVKDKIKGTQLEDRIELHKCEEDKIGLEEKVDFINAFYVIHEIPDQENLFREIKTILKPEGKMMIVEPPFHVNRKKFDVMVKMIESIGFRILERRRAKLSRLIVVSL